MASRPWGSLVGTVRIGSRERILDIHLRSSRSWNVPKRTGGTFSHRGFQVALYAAYELSRTFVAGNPHRGSGTTTCDANGHNARTSQESAPPCCLTGASPSLIEGLQGITCG